MQHFLTTADWSRPRLQSILDDARNLKAEPYQARLRNKTIALIFFNPSLRTRSSFDIGAHQMGAHAVVLEPGKGSWPMEFELGSVMDQTAEEHVREAARVLSRYCDLIAVRAFPQFEDWQVDRQDRVIHAFAKHATVPVINMETITHPCQELALMLTLQERLGMVDGMKFVLTWTYHPKPLNTAVANSALLIASKFGMDVTLLCPNEDYILDERYMGLARQYTSEQGRSLTVTHNIEEAYSGANVVYAKSWGALPYFGRWDEEKPVRDAHKHFIVDAEKMALTDNGLFSHCLPCRRNVKVTDEVIDSPNSLVIDEAENRLHVQKALMSTLING
ncbi:N-acetylornithine carbamoyltransferase [Bradymonadaceae bacterium TMQ3]|uniref:N-acetylornithine carbamoyltransferase n=1 Tax=Lujinxingia sediminis TaxID=2480984 RepID=A0ABY0CT92_9DELT|nr:N-acetylornithine carbamoyltransferase [Lujinxingia sediminis]RDV38633.1 N-acetylornithine carbamoyltransferase [Bradymonadaceae bacterium TMQ3]RVU44816.1 N-acetylornithine carbamoyltransferase [Lujinxingia sediminis]TXC76595.1 N-acetylornithine carbamoyltransferase [Bradymonadales bacterium TMQ1]